MSKADEMFEKLNYIKSYDDEYKAIHYSHRYFEDEFVFYEDTENIGVCLEAISVQELQALNEKVKELRMDKQAVKQLNKKMEE